jgi:hypothetical protein
VRASRELRNLRLTRVDQAFSRPTGRDPGATQIVFDS